MFKVKSLFLFLLISILLVSVPTPREMDAESNDEIELQESASTDSIECNKQEGTEDDDLKDEEENEIKCLEKANSYETIKDDTASSIMQESSEQNTEEPVEFEEPIQSEDENQEVINKESDEPNEPELEKSDSSEEQTEEKQSNSSNEQAEEKDSNSNSDVEENEEESKEKDGLDYEQVAPQRGLIDVGLLTGVKLTANHTIENGQDHISLKLTGRAVLNLGVLQSTYVIFQLPPEITSVMKEESLEATYDVPGLLGIGRRDGAFSKSDIKVDSDQIYINFKKILALSIGGRYEFTLDFDIDTLPPSYEKKYTFYGQTTSQIINISLIDLNKLGKATISAPDGKLSFYFIPETLAFETTELPTRRTAINRENPNWNIEVKDTRKERSAWKIHAQAAPLTSVENPVHQLPNALIYMDEQQNKTIISSEAITVFSSEGGPDEITSVQWKKNEGPLIQVGPGEAVPGEYETRITWTLVDAP